MSNTNNGEIIKYRGRFGQISLYLKKLFRMFIFMNDWKVIPMSALVALISSIAVSKGMFVDMEGTLKGALALSCICIWNGFFNSIQSICRERDVVKREHRNGMHITAYVTAHMIYQAFICLIQTIVTICVSELGGMRFHSDTMSDAGYYIFIGVTLFLVTYSADMMSLMISAIAKTTTAAMTIMPFMLIFELVFSNSVFTLPGKLSSLTDLSLAKWGIRGIAAQANYNSLPFVSAWNQINRFADVEYEGMQPIKMFLTTVDKDTFCKMAAEHNQVADYTSSISNIGTCWMALIIYSLIFAAITVIMLKRIDSDKR